MKQNRPIQTMLKPTALGKAGDDISHNVKNIEIPSNPVNSGIVSSARKKNTSREAAERCGFSEFHVELTTFLL